MHIQQPKQIKYSKYAISRALEEGNAEFLMIGDSTILKKYPTLKQYPEYVKTIHIENPDEAAREAVRIVREGGADILMKGIINTDNLLHAILDKEKGLLPKGKILTHLAVMEIPTYHSASYFTATYRNDLVCYLYLPSLWYRTTACRTDSLHRKSECQVPSFTRLCEYRRTCRSGRIRKCDY